MKKNIYIDFDSTIFDTNAFYSDFLKLCSKYNVDEKSVNEIRNKIFLKDSDFNLDILGKNIYSKYILPEDFLNSLESLYSSRYLYKDAINYLEKQYLKHNIILLTYGNKEYQNKKIINSNIAKYFKDIIITEDSKSNLKINFLNSIFIDNNPKEITSFYNKGARHLIRVRKENDNYSNFDLYLDNVLEIENFDEL